MIRFVLENSDGFYVRHHSDWNYNCGGNEVSKNLDDAAVFQAELTDGKLELVEGKFPEGNWTARAVQVFLRE